MGFSVATATYLGIGDPDEDVMDLFSLDFNYDYSIVQHCWLLGYILRFYWIPHMQAHILSMGLILMTPVLFQDLCESTDAIVLFLLYS